MKFRELLLFLPFSLLAQTWTVAEIGETTQSTISMYGATSVTATQPYIEYGTSTGVYTTVSRPVNATVTAAKKYHSWYISGLTANTTYYFRICATSGSVFCSSEKTATTLANNSFLAPTAPTAFNYTSTTSAGTVRTVGADCDDPTTGFLATWNLSSWGDIIEIPPTTTCKGQFTIPTKAPDGSSPHRWITIRPTTYANLPPDGTRVSDSDVTNMVTFMGQTPAIFESTIASLPVTCAEGKAYWVSDDPRAWKLRQCNNANTFVEVSYTTGAAIPATCTKNDWFVLNGVTDIRERSYWCTSDNNYNQIRLRTISSYEDNATLNFRTNGVGYVRLEGINMEWTPLADMPYLYTVDTFASPAFEADLQSLNGYLSSPFFKPIIIDRCRFAESTYGKLREATIYINGSSSITDSIIRATNNWKGSTATNISEGSTAIFYQAWSDGPHDLQNNEISGVGITVYAATVEAGQNVNPNYLMHDFTAKKNWIYWPIEYAFCDPDWTGVRKAWGRHTFESKVAFRVLMEGNTMEGNCSSINQGSSYGYLPRIDNITFSYLNITSNVATCQYPQFSLCQGLQVGDWIALLGTAPYDGPFQVSVVNPDNSFEMTGVTGTTTGVQFFRMKPVMSIKDVNVTYNVFQDTPTGLFNGGFTDGAGAGTSPATINLAGQRIAVTNNWFNVDASRGTGPDGYTLLSSRGMNYFNFSNNTMRNQGVNGGITNDTSTACPAVANSTECTRSMYLKIDRNLFNVEASSNPVIIGGTPGTAILNSYWNSWTSTNNYIIRATNPANLSGFSYLSSLNWVNGSGVNSYGVDQTSGAATSGILSYDTLRETLGVINNVNVIPSGTTSLIVSWNPASKSCSIDRSTDGFTTFTRSTGTSPLTLSSLTTKTFYALKLHCYTTEHLKGRTN